jgi:hypothetical protein
MSQSAAEPASPSGVVAAVRRFGDPLAFLLLGYIGLEYLFAVGHLLIERKSFAGIGSSFADRASTVDSSFLNLFFLFLVAVAVVLATVIGQRSKLARPIVITALAIVGAGAVLGFLTMLIGLFSDIPTTRDKVETVLTELVIIAVFVVVGLVLLALLSSPELRPAPKPQPAYQQYPGAPQGYPGYPPPGQPGYGGYQPQGQYDSQPTYQQPVAPAYDPPPPHGAPTYDPQPQHGAPQQGHQHDPPPPIWEQSEPPQPPPPPQQSSWPPPPPPQQPPGQQRWPEGNQ